MRLLSDSIEDFIKALMADEQDQQQAIELRRNELAEHFQCAPSQINYVLATRFTPDHGYVIESRRGGGGCLRIRRIEVTDDVSHVLSSMKDTLDVPGAKAIVSFLYDRKRITAGEAKMLLACSESLKKAGSEQNKLRAETFKNMITALL